MYRKTVVRRWCMRVRRVYNGHNGTKRDGADHAGAKQSDAMYNVVKQVSAVRYDVE